MGLSNLNQADVGKSVDAIYFAVDRFARVAFEESISLDCSWQSESRKKEKPQLKGQSHAST